MHALGLRNGIAFPQLIAATDGSIQVIEVAARIPGGQMADLVQHAVGVDLVEVALRFALGEPVTDEIAAPKKRQPVAIRFFTAEPGPLPAGKVKAPASLDKVLTAPGVVQAASYIVAGETIRPVKVDGDRRGYVIAVGSTGTGGARARGAGGPPRRGRGRVTCLTAALFDLAHYVELLDAARDGGYRFAFFDREPRPGDVLLRHDVDMSLAAAVTMAELEAERDVRATYFLMTRSDFYNLDAPLRCRRARAPARARPSRRPARRLSRRDARRPLRSRSIAWHTPDPDYMSAPIPGVVNVMQEGYFDPGALPLGLEPALAERLPARGARGRQLRLAAAARAPRDLGVRGSDDARDDGVAARRRARAALAAARRESNRSLEPCVSCTAR